MNIELFNFTKRTNSTLRPTTGGTTKTVRLKEPTDIKNPVFIMEGIDNTSSMCIWNGAYYFVTNRVYLTNNIMELHCSIDPGGTASDDIKGYTCFVERASSNYDTMIEDGLLSGTQEIVDRKIEVKSILESGVTAGFSTTGCYFVRTIAKSTNSATGINAYAISGSDLKDLLNYAFDDSHYSWFSDASNEFIKAVFNPFEYIIDVKWVPMTASTLSGTNQTESIWLGWWDTGVQGYNISHLGQVFDYAVPMPNTWYYNDFRKYDKNYTRCSLTLPFVGVIDIDPIELSLGTLRVTYAIDHTTIRGHCWVNICGTNDNIIKTIGYYEATYSANMQLAQTSTDVKRMMGDAVAGIGNWFAGNYAGSATALVDVATTVTNPSKNMLGAPSSIMDLLSVMQIKFEVDSFGTKDFPTSVAGRPLMQNVQLGTLSGFVKCGNASIPLANAMIRDEVNQMLNSGIYIE